MSKHFRNEIATCTLKARRYYRHNVFFSSFNINNNDWDHSIKSVTCATINDRHFQEYLLIFRITHIIKTSILSTIYLYS